MSSFIVLSSQPLTRTLFPHGPVGCRCLVLLQSINMRYIWRQIDMLQVAAGYRIVVDAPLRTDILRISIIRIGIA